MTNEQRKQALELLFFDPMIAFDPPAGGNYLPEDWLCSNCAEYNIFFKWDKIDICSIRQKEDGKDDILTWSYYHYKDDPRPVEINAVNGEVIKGHDKLEEFHTYLKQLLRQHVESAIKLLG